MWRSDFFSLRLLCSESSAAPCVLLRAKEYAHVSADFAQRLLATSSGGKKLFEAASKGRLVGLHLAGDNCLAELAHRVKIWNGKGSPSAHAAFTPMECSHLCNTFFEDADAGQDIRRGHS